MILDGMNVERYCESGMPADLSEILAEVANSEGLYDSIAYTYEMDGMIYAVPARFQIPIMVGKEEDINQITDFASLQETPFKAIIVLTGCFLQFLSSLESEKTKNLNFTKF